MVKPCVVSSACGLRRSDSTELKKGDDGFEFGTSEPGAGPFTVPSPAPMVTNSVRPRNASPDGPDGALLGGAKPEGSPSSRVRRLPALSMIEMRPLFGPLPASATSRLPLGVNIALTGDLRPEAKTEVV